MNTMTDLSMQQIDGGGFWSSFACGAALVTTAGGIVMLTASTGGLAAPLVFAAGWSLWPGTCAIALVT